jgi:uncharacterized protein YutE (UPF0331/DUF86 family)
MVDADVVKAKLLELSHRVSRVRAHVTATAEALAADEDRLDLVAFNLMLAVQSAADIASHLITDEGWPAVKNLAESFVRLREQGARCRDGRAFRSRAIRDGGRHVGRAALI